MENSTPRYAGFWVRAIASILDTFILALPLMIFVAIISGGEYMDLSAMQEAMMQAQSGNVQALQHSPKTSMQWEIVFELLMAAVIIVFWKRWMGATPGKKIMGITVVDAKTLSLMSNQQAITRYIGYLASILPLGFGFFIVAFRKDKRALHDLLANTAVIYTDN